MLIGEDQMLVGEDQQLIGEEVQQLIGDKLLGKLKHLKVNQKIIVYQ